MGGFDDPMLAAVYVRSFGFGVVAPEDEDKILALFGELANDCVGEFFPAFALMTARGTRPHSEGSI